MTYVIMYIELCITYFILEYMFFIVYIYETTNYLNILKVYRKTDEEIKRLRKAQIKKRNNIKRQNDKKKTNDEMTKKRQMIKWQKKRRNDKMTKWQKNPRETKLQNR